MSDDEFDRKVNEKVNELMELVEEQYEDKPVTERAAVLVDTVIAKHRLTWFGAFKTFSDVMVMYGYQASVQCGEIKDEDMRDMFHQDGQVVMPFFNKDYDDEGVDHVGH